jgi:hypothetical protein
MAGTPTVSTLSLPARIKADHEAVKGQQDDRESDPESVVTRRTRAKVLS